MKTYGIRPDGTPGSAFWLESSAGSLTAKTSEVDGVALAYGTYQTDLHVWMVAPAADLAQWTELGCKEAAVDEVKRIVGRRA